MKKTESKEYKKYTFSGAVLKFGIPVSTCWHAETVAPSKERALSNLKYRYKKEHGLISSVQIELDGKIIPN